MNLEQQIKYRLLRKQISLERESLQRKAAEIENFLETERAAEKALFKIAALSSDKAGVIVKAGLKIIYGRGEETDFKRQTGDKTPTLGGFPLAEAHGLGVSEVVAVLLRLVGIKKKIGGQLNTLILDEALSNVDKYTLPKVLDFIKKIGVRLGINILDISHRPESAEQADVLYKFKKIGSRTKATRVELGDWGAKKDKRYEF